MPSVKLSKRVTVNCQFQTIDAVHRSIFNFLKNLKPLFSSCPPVNLNLLRRAYQGCGKEMSSTFSLENNLPKFTSHEIPRLIYRLKAVKRRGALHPLSNFSGCGRTPSNDAPVTLKLPNFTKGQKIPP